MHPYQRLPGTSFDRLIARTEAARLQLMQRGDAMLLLPPPQQRPDGIWRDPYFVAYDAVQIVITDILAQQRGIGRGDVSKALPLLQLALINSVDRTGDIWCGVVARPDGAAQVMFGKPAQIRRDAAFLRLPGTSRAWFASVREAVETVRRRAREHGIELPRKFTLTTAEAKAELAAALRERQAEHASQ